MGIHWVRQSAFATLAGLLVGTAFAVGLTLMGTPQWGGVHVGVIGLGLNIAVVVALSIGERQGIPGDTPLEELA
jgi:Na+/proline symporter